MLGPFLWNSVASFLLHPFPIWDNQSLTLPLSIRCLTLCYYHFYYYHCKIFVGQCFHCILWLLMCLITVSSVSAHYKIICKSYCHYLFFKLPEIKKNSVLSMMILKRVMTHVLFKHSYYFSHKLQFYSVMRFHLLSLSQVLALLGHTTNKVCSGFHIFNPSDNSKISQVCTSEEIWVLPMVFKPPLKSIKTANKALRNNGIISIVYVEYFEVWLRVIE